MTIKIRSMIDQWSKLRLFFSENEIKQDQGKTDIYNRPKPVFCKKDRYKEAGNQKNGK